jgi:hypothetical protein
MRPAQRRYRRDLRGLRPRGHSRRVFRPARVMSRSCSRSCEPGSIHHALTLQRDSARNGARRGRCFELSIWVQNRYVRDGTLGVACPGQPRLNSPLSRISCPFVASRGRPCHTRRCLVMKGSPVRIWASALYANRSQGVARLTQNSRKHWRVRFVVFRVLCRVRGTPTVPHRAIRRVPGQGRDQAKGRDIDVQFKPTDEFGTAPASTS